MLTWIIPALIFSFIRASFTMINEWAKLPGTVMLVWRGFWPFIIMTPVMWFIDMPQNPLFYLYVACNAVFAAVTDARNFESASRFGGGVTLRLQPVSLVLVFLGWLAISPEQRALVLSHPYHMMGIIVCLALGAYALSHLRHCTVSKQAFIYLLPIICMSPLVDIFNKLSMDSVGTWHAVVTYIWFQSGFMAVLAILFLGFKQKKNLESVTRISKHHLVFGMLVAFILILGGLTKGTAMMLTSNPAYVTAIAMIAPIWATLFYKAIGKKEEANVTMGLAFVVCVAAMLLIAGLIPHSQ